MTTVEQIRAEITEFKATVVRGVDRFVAEGHVAAADGDRFLSTVGIERPESAEVRAAREELEALRTTVRNAVSTYATPYQRDEALRAFGLTA